GRDPQSGARTTGETASGDDARRPRCTSMMLRVAWRSLMTRPIQAAVLAAGFGFGIAVMVALLGVGQVILEQSRAPALQGGGDLVVSGQFGPVSSARFVISAVKHAPEIASR